MTYQFLSGEIRVQAVERPTGWKILTMLGGEYFVTWLKQGANGAKTGRYSTSDANRALELFDSVNLNE